MGLLSFAALLSASLGPQAATPQADPATTTGALGLQVRVQLPNDKAVGSRKAGMLCLPNGRFTAQNFFPSEEYLKTLLLGAYQEKIGEPLQEKVKSLTVNIIKVNLCANDYIFEKNKYKGTVDADFEVVWSGSSISQENISLKIQDAQSETEIAQTVVKAIVEILTNHP